MAIFVGKNGMLAMGNKTPVTLLQETLQKKGITPHYHLIYDGTGTLQPVFKYQVTAPGLSAIGDGRTKKEAKHDAAASLLKRMQVNKAITENSDITGTEEIDIASPYAGSIKENFVGMLEDVCVNNKVPFPAYVHVKEEGPPHAKVFTMQCIVGSASEKAIARTKKQAKHLSAMKMMKRVAQILGDMFIPLAEKTEPFEEVPNLKAIEDKCFHPDLSIPFNNYHNVFHVIEGSIFSEIFLQLSTKPLEFYLNMENPMEFLENVVQELKGTCRINNFTKTELSSTLQETEKVFENWYIDNDNSIEVDQADNSDFYEDETNLENYILKEFDLGDSDSEVQPVINKPIVDTESVTAELGAFSLNDKSSCVFLTVECPQGEWTFRGISDEKEKAVKNAAVEAITFLRALSIPPAGKQSFPFVEEIST